MQKIIDNFQEEFAFLSNFAKFTLGNAICTVEHLYQAEKTLDLKEREMILQAKTPGRAKKLGRKVCIRPDWESIKEAIMLNLVRQKFHQNKYLAELLLKTEDAILIEGNIWHDNLWGSCYCEKCQFIEGQNLLGKILMKVRSELR